MHWLEQLLLLEGRLIHSQGCSISWWAKSKQCHDCVWDHRIVKIFDSSPSVDYDLGYYCKEIQCTFDLWFYIKDSRLALFARSSAIVDFAFYCVEHFNRHYDLVAKDFMETDIEKHLMSLSFTYDRALRLLETSDLKTFPIVDNRSKFLCSVEVLLRSEPISHWIYYKRILGEVYFGLLFSATKITKRIGKRRQQSFFWKSNSLTFISTS